MAMEAIKLNQTYGVAENLPRRFGPEDAAAVQTGRLEAEDKARHEAAERAKAE